MLAWLWLGLVAAGCQCFVPVEERVDGGGDGGRDAGADAGTDAGTDAGSADAGTDAGSADAGATDAGCARAAQCVGGAQPTTNWCGGGAAFSCVASTCLWECPIVVGARTCGIDGGCLSCLDAGTECPQVGNCGGPTGVGSAFVEPGSACANWPGTTIAFTNLTIVRTASAECRYLAYQAAGTQNLGELWRLSSGDYLAYFPSFGGWCTGRSAFTGAPRAIFNCPACQFVLVGFE